MKRTRWSMYRRWGVGLALGLLALALVQVALAAGGIDPTHKWAWGANIGWVNFTPDFGGVTVYGDHLEGYAWGENIGWIRLGTHTGGGNHTYANTTAGNYGVNRGPNGALSGYAWGANVGWINFSPDYGGVTINPQAGVFSGCAWGENVGWISFRGPAYQVVTNFRESLAPAISGLVPASGAMGAIVMITGTNFTGATGVQFNGHPAVFRVIASASLSATVPALATTGPISITTPGGTATSSQAFVILTTGNHRVFLPLATR